MKILLDDEAINNSELTLAEVLVIMISANKLDYSEAVSNLINKGYISKSYEYNGYFVTDKGANAFNQAVINSQPEVENRDWDELLQSLREVFPKGKKDGTTRLWVESDRMIKERFVTFFKKYGDHYTNQQIINAAKKYVEGFNGSYKYMSILRYFIFKDKKGAENVEKESELLNYIETDTDDLITDSWTIESLI